MKNVAVLFLPSRGIISLFSPRTCAGGVLNPSMNIPRAGTVNIED